MSMINVRTKKGRRAFEAAHAGAAEIPDNRFVPVPLTHYVKRLIEVHGDLEVEGDDGKTDFERAAEEEAATKKNSETTKSSSDNKSKSGK